MEADYGEIKEMKEGIIIKSKKNTARLLMYAILLFPILGENVISTVFGDAISKFLSVISCGIILLFFLIRKIHISIFLIDMFLLILLHVFVFVSSDADISIANNMISPYGLIAYCMLFLFIDAFIDNREKLIVLFKSMVIIMTISVFMNFFFTADLHIADNIAVFREAVSTGYTNSRHWLFGHRNMIFIHHIMWITFSYIQYILENRNYARMFFFQIAFTMLVGVISWNSTMMFTTLVIFGLGIFRKHFLKKISILHYILIYVILEIGIVFFRIQDVFSYLIVDILHRNLSFTGRTRIWDYYIKQFSNGSFFHKLFGNFGVTELAVNSHNMFLGILSFTGITGALLYFFLFFIGIKNLHGEKNTDSAKFISVIIFGFLINALTMEFYLQPMIAIYIGYRIKDINQLVSIWKEL